MSSRGSFFVIYPPPPGNQVSTGELLKRLISSAGQNRAEKSFVGTTVRMWLAHWQEPWLLGGTWKQLIP